MADGPGARRHDSLDLERDGFRVQLGRTTGRDHAGSRLTSARKAEITRYKGALRTLLRVDDGCAGSPRGLPGAIDAAKRDAAGAAVRADVPLHPRPAASVSAPTISPTWRSAAAGGASLGLETARSLESIVRHRQSILDRKQQMPPAEGRA